MQEEDAVFFWAAHCVFRLVSCWVLFGMKLEYDKPTSDDLTVN